MIEVEGMLNSDSIRIFGALPSNDPEVATDYDVDMGEAVELELKLGVLRERMYNLEASITFLDSL
jgi:hypothetical protein